MFTWESIINSIAQFKSRDFINLNRLSFYVLCVICMYNAHCTVSVYVLVHVYCVIAINFVLFSVFAVVVLVDDASGSYTQHYTYMALHTKPFRHVRLVRNPYAVKLLYDDGLYYPGYDSSLCSFSPQLPIIFLMLWRKHRAQKQCVAFNMDVVKYVII